MSARVAALEAQGLIEKVEERMVPVGRAQRSGAVIEYRLSDQWFVRMKPLAEKALAASGYVRRGEEWVSTGAREIFFHPPRWEKIYFDWLSRIRDWTISRQIWWGHRIPAWYHKETGEILVDVETPQAVRENPELWEQDPDVLDTWFSSWLWPMTTLGWPEETPDLKRYFPTSVLSTAKDIIFFWVARMNFASLEMTGQLPYRDVYIHPTVLDERGATMSKVKGNGIDPLAVIDGATREELTGPILEARPENAKELLVRVEKNFPEGFEGVGADALRFTLVHTCSEGQELRLSLQRFHDIGRRFVTKLWNASRYALLTLEAAPGPEAGEAAPTVEDRWIVSRTATTIRDVRRGIESFDFGTVGQELYRFVWNDYCDWYLELTKPRISGDDPAAARRAAHVLGTTLAQILRMLHPVTPFITEELWSMLLPAMDAKDLWMGKRPESELLVLEKTPVSEGEPDLELEARFESLQRLVGRIRTSRANARVAENVALTAAVRPLQSGLREILEETATVAKGLANLEELTLGDSRPEGSIAFVDPSFELYLNLGKHVDVAAERKRLDKEIADTRGKLEHVTRKLENPKFLSGAKPEVVEEQRARDAEYRDVLRKLEEMKREYGESA